MAILIESEKKPVNWIGIISTIIVVAVLFFGVYYIFFKKPELIDVVAPGSLGDLSRLSKLTFEPDKVLGSDVFRALRQFGTEPVIQQAGRLNPFKPF